MKINAKKLLATAMLFGATLLAQQMPYFTTPNYKFWTAPVNPSGSPLISGGTQGTYNVANGCYDNNGNLLFYVTENGIYNTSGTNVGGFGYPGYSNVWCSSCGGYVNEYYNQLSCTEFEIVPVPGSCRVYYVIYSMQLITSGNKYCYIKVDCSSGSPVVIYNGTVTAPGKPTANAAFVFGAMALDGASICFAASNIISGSGSTAVRYLYTVNSFNGIRYHSITNTGIGGGAVMSYGVSGAGYNASELELSPDGQWLAWTTGGASTCIGQLNGAKTGFVSGQQWVANASGTAKGIEFTGGSNPRLYIAGGGGLSYVNTATQSQPFGFSSGSYDFTNTFLERGINGKIYGVSKTVSAQGLIGIDPATNAFTGVPVTFDSRYNISNGLWANGIYTLPNQIDGQDYSDFDGNPLAKVTSIAINNTNIEGVGNCDQGGILEFCASSPVLLNVTTVNPVVQYKLEIIGLDADCYPLSWTVSNMYMEYNGPWINGAPPANIDLRSFTDANGFSLYSRDLNYLVRLSVKDLCGNVSSKSGYAIVHISPNPVLKIYQTATSSYVNASQNIAAPINQGALSAAISVNGSTGPVISYNITIDQVNSSGVFIKNIYNKTTTSYNMSAISPLSLNGLCVNNSVWTVVPGGGNCTSTSPSYSGYTGYFGYMNGQLSVGNYYKITLSMDPGTGCPQASTYSYVYINTGYARPGEVTGLTDVSNELASSFVYPNPANDKVYFTINSPLTDTYTIRIYDIVGKPVAEVAGNIALSAGENTIELSTKDISTGVYTYKIEAKSYSKSGLLSITK